MKKETREKDEKSCEKQGRKRNEERMRKEEEKGNTDIEKETKLYKRFQKVDIFKLWKSLKKKQNRINFINKLIRNFVFRYT